MPYTLLTQIRIEGKVEDFPKCYAPYRCRLTTIMMHNLMFCSSQTVLAEVKHFRQLVSCEVHDWNSALVVKAGCLAKFVELLQPHHNWELHHESAWMLGNMSAQGNIPHLAVVESGALPGLVQLLASTHPEVRFSAAWACMNLAGSGRPVTRDILLSHNAHTHLLPVVADERSLVGTIATYAIRNLCRDNLPSPTFDTLAPCLPGLASLVPNSNHMVSKYACWALADIGLIHGSRLLSVLAPDFTHSISRLHEQQPDRSSVQNLLEVLEKLESATDPDTYAQEELKKSDECGYRGRDAGDGSGTQTAVKRRKQRPSTPGVTTRSLTKRYRVNGTASLVSNTI